MMKKVDIVDVFGTSFVGRDEQHPRIQAFYQSIGQSSEGIASVTPFDMNMFVHNILKEPENTVTRALSGVISLDQVRLLGEYHTQRNALWQPKGMAFSEWKKSEQYAAYNALESEDTGIAYDAFSKWLKNIVLSHTQNILINTSEAPLNRIQKTSKDAFLIIAGSPDANCGHGVFKVDEFRIENSTAKKEDDVAHFFPTSTIEMTHVKTVEWQGVHQLEDILNAYS